MPHIPYQIESYVGGAPQAVLSGTITSSATTINVSGTTASGWSPLGQTGGFVLALDYNTSNEEKIWVPSGSYPWGSPVVTLSGVERAYDGTGLLFTVSGYNHQNGSNVVHVLAANDLSEANKVVNLMLGSSPMVYNVKAYGAKGDGTTDDTTVINLAIADANVSGGEVFFPTGVFLLAAGLTSIASNVTIRGSSIGATTVKGAPSFGAIFTVVGTSGTHVENVSIEDLTVDIQSTANASALIHYYCDNLSVRRVSFINSSFKYVQTQAGAGGSLTDCTKILFEDCIFGAQSGSQEQITLANTTDVTFLKCVGLANSYIWVLLYQNVLRSRFIKCDIYGAGSAVTLSFSCNDIKLIGCYSQCEIAGVGTSDHGTFGYSYVEDLVTENCTFDGNAANATALSINAHRNYRDLGSTFCNWTQSPIEIGTMTNAPIDAKFIGSVFRSNDRAAYAWGIFYCSTGATSVSLENCTFDDDQGTPTQGNVFNLANAVAYNNFQMSDCKFVGGSSGSGLIVGAGTVGTGWAIRNNTLNPVGSAVPGTAFARPSSTATWTNSTGVDGTLYCTTPTGCTAVSINGVALGAPIADASYRIVAGGTFTPTYTGTPVFVFVGD